ncbi:MAG: formyltetrahydrofolate deformylase [Trueperaceae bacterium]|nr:formyltetrahydrofolate deformylase [Trueperaceae bacterium]
MKTKENTARLLISCADRPGIVATVSQFLAAQGANILDSRQHSTDPEAGRFFMRMVFYLDDLINKREALDKAFQSEVAERFAMDYRFSRADRRKRMAILVSKYDHCLLELLWKWQREELEVDIPLVISNHDDLRKMVESYGLAYYYLPLTKDTKPAQETEIDRLLQEHNIDFAVLARYMQILSKNLAEKYSSRIINIHHSFLPAFIGANPYKKAYERGVKLIGATAHYVTDDLDEGPIIEQDVERVSHRDQVDDLVRIGRDIERKVLAKAVQAHVEDRVIIFENKTVVL